MTLTLYKPKVRKGQALQIKKLEYDAQADRYVIEGVWWDISNIQAPRSTNLEEKLRLSLKAWQNDWEQLKLADF